MAPQADRGRRRFLELAALAPFAPGLAAPRERPQLQQEQAAGSRPPGPGLDRYLRELIQRKQIPGLSVAVVRDGALHALHAYGHASIELDHPATPSTVYQIASVSKIFAGIAAGLLAQDGRLSLDEPISRVLREAPSSWSAVSVGHLLSHTSGLGSLRKNPRVAELKSRREEQWLPPEHLDQISGDEVVALLAEVPSVFEPGARWQYGQAGYIVFGQIVRRIAGESYEAFLDKRVFQPLRMSSARFGDSRVVVPGRAPTAYSRQSRPLQSWIWPYATFDYPAAGLNVSAADLARLFQAIQGGELLPQAAWTRLWEPARLGDGGTARYGLGWTSVTLGGERAVGHEGGGCCWVTHLPGSQVSVMVLSNLAGARADTTADDVALMVRDGRDR